MTLVLSPPEWKAVNKHYNIKISWDSPTDNSVLSDTVLDNESFMDPLLTEDSAKRVINIVLDSLITQGKRWFAKPLQESTVRNRLKHEYFTKSLSESIKRPDPPFQIQWIPTEIHISSAQFILVWSIINFKEMKSQIPISFLEDDVEDGLLEVDFEKVVSVQPGDPFSLTQNQEQTKNRERVKAARIRAAIAKYKAEVLAQEYRELYGDLSDSEEDENENAESEVGETDEGD